jgi:hypothetical protein
MAERWKPQVSDFRDVIQLLAEYMDGENDPDRMADYAQLDRRSIVRAETVRGMWEERFKAAIRQGKLSALLLALHDEADVIWAADLAEGVRAVAERALFGVVGDRYQTLEHHLDALHGSETNAARLSQARRLRDIARAVRGVLDQAGLWEALPVFAADSSLEEVHRSLGKQSLRVIEAAGFVIGLVVMSGASTQNEALPAENETSTPVRPEDREHLRATVRATAALATEARELLLTLSFRIAPTKTR